MGIMKQFAQSTGLIPCDGVVGERILEMQYQQLVSLIPLLYLTVGFYFLMAIIFVVTQVEIDSTYDIIMSYMLPCIVVPLSITRTLIWYRRRSAPFDAEKVAKILISLTLVSGLICIISGIWSVMAWYSNANDQRFFIPLIMAMGAFSVAYCLSIIPFSAAFNLVAALLPLNLVMLFSGETFLIAVAVTVMIAMIYLTALLRRHFYNMVRMIELQVQMHDLANTDILTGLLNRRALIEEYRTTVYGESNSLVSLMVSDEDTDEDNQQPQSAISNSMKVDSEITNITMVMLDLDGFKPINDIYGHEAGDKMLKMIASRMAKHIGEYGTIARIGGDEFAILFVNKPVQFCHQMIESLSYILSAPYVIDGEEKSVGISYGLAHNDDNIGSIERLLSKADAELYNMKAQKYNKNHIEDGVRNHLNVIPNI